jgi:hypothetical protein
VAGACECGNEPSGSMNWAFRIISDIWNNCCNIKSTDLFIFNCNWIDTRWKQSVHIWLTPGGSSQYKECRERNMHTNKKRKKFFKRVNFYVYCAVLKRLSTPSDCHTQLPSVVPSAHS